MTNKLTQYNLTLTFSSKSLLSYMSFLLQTKAYLGLAQASMMKPFEKIISRICSLTIFITRSCHREVATGGVL